MQKIRQTLPAQFHDSLIDSFDQEHAMIIGEGTKAGLFQSIMMKPANVQPVYPMRFEDKNEQTLIYLDGQGPIVIFNYEGLDPKSPLNHFWGVESAFESIVAQLKRLSARGYEVVVLHDKTLTKPVQAELAGSNIKSLTVSENNVDLDKGSWRQVNSLGRRIVWVSQCTQANFFTAIETFGAAIVGFAKEEMSNQQVYNCHKLKLQHVGSPLLLEEFVGEGKTGLSDEIESLLRYSSFTGVFD